MKLDLDYIKVLLNTINDCESDRVSMAYLFENMNIEESENDLQEKKLRHHLSILYNAGFIEASNHSLGFREGLDGTLLCVTNATYWPTMEGYKLLESLNNDTLFHKIKGGLKTIGVETLRQIPALAIECIKSII